MAKNVDLDYEKGDGGDEVKVKIICLGDSAVGKSKLVERFLVDGYKPQQLSTYALTLYNYKTEIKGRKVAVDFWDTAGQERFSSMHPSYYHQAHACIMVFDATRKITYKNLPNWYKELREYRPEIPCLCAANKIDIFCDPTPEHLDPTALINKSLIRQTILTKPGGDSILIQALHTAPDDLTNQMFSNIQELMLLQHEILVMTNTNLQGFVKKTFPQCYPKPAGYWNCDSTFEIQKAQREERLIFFGDNGITKKSFNFPTKQNMPLFFVSASDGTNVVKLFRNAIQAAVGYKLNSTDFIDEVMKELENFDLDSRDYVSEDSSTGSQERETAAS